MSWGSLQQSTQRTEGGSPGTQGRARSMDEVIILEDDQRAQAFVVCETAVATEDIIVEVYTCPDFFEKTGLTLDFSTTETPDRLIRSAGDWSADGVRVGMRMDVFAADLAGNIDAWQVAALPSATALEIEETVPAETDLATALTEDPSDVGAKLHFGSWPIVPSYAVRFNPSVADYAYTIPLLLSGGRYYQVRTKLSANITGDFKSQLFWSVGGPA